MQTPDPSSEARQATTEELLADEALGSLEPAGRAELRARGVRRNPFHDLVADLTQELVPAGQLPADLARVIEHDAPQWVRVPMAVARRPTLRLGTWAGWIVAAAACAALVLTHVARLPAPPGGPVAGVPPA
ncbi:MAG: hypothetical protein RMJ35_05775, partial [Phycisphaerales bacterium]|nr:hypothetical protein [Phycisphaerales bacterium]